MPAPGFLTDVLEAGEAGGTPAPTQGFLDALLHSNPPPSEGVPPPAEGDGGGWGVGSALAQGATLGAYASASAYAKSLLHGTSYGAERKKVAAEQEAYAKEYPTGSSVTELIGSLPTTLGAMALGQEYAAAPLLTKLGQLAPRAAAYATQGEGAVPWALRAGGRLAGYGTQGALSGVSQMGLTGQSLEDALQVGGLTGMVAGPVGSALAAPLKSALTPAVQSIGKKFEDLGINLYTNQLPGAPLATKFAGAGARPQQVSDFTRALSHTFGEDAGVIDNELLHGSGGKAGAFDRIGATMENAARSSTIPGNDPQMIGALNQTLKRAESEFGSDSPEFAKLKRLFDGVQGAAQGGDISGKSYLDLTQKGSAIKNAMARTSPTRQYAIEMKDALDDALERANPAQAKEIARARHQWHNAIIAEDNVDPLTGLANPRTLLGSVESGRHYGSAFMAAKKAAQAGDSGDIGTLAVGGKAFLSAPEGGALNYMKHHPGMTVAAGVGLGAGGHLIEPLAEHLSLMHPYAAAAGMGLGAGYGVAGAAMNRPAYAGMLLRGFDPARAAPNAMVPAASMLYGQPPQ